MDKFVDYINSSLPDKKGDDLLYKFKKKTLDKMNEQYNTVMQRGVSNAEVLSDLVISDYPDLKADFAAYKNKELAFSRAKRNTIMNIVGSITYILILIISFLGIGFSTHVWSPTWLIVVDGILLWVVYILSLCVNKMTHGKPKKGRQLMRLAARIFMAMDVMVAAVAVFLFCLSYLKIEKSWLILILGVAGMFVADAIYALATKQKLAIINILFYMPAVATMLYIIFAAFGVLAWSTGWLLIIAALILNLIIIFVRLTVNKKQKLEVIDAWQEN